MEIILTLSYFPFCVAQESEEEMFHNVMLYVDRIFAAVRPRKVLFLAIDGVAPRAKLNQQRTRRFRSAQEAREKEASKRSTREVRRMIIDQWISSCASDCGVDDHAQSSGEDFDIALAGFFWYRKW